MLPRFRSIRFPLDPAMNKSPLVVSPFPHYPRAPLIPSQQTQQIPVALQFLVCHPICLQFFHSTWPSESGPPPICSSPRGTVVQHIPQPIDTHADLQPPPPTASAKRVLVEGPEADRISRFREVLDGLRDLCIVCWALGTPDPRHPLTKCRQGICNALDDAWLSFRCSINLPPAHCFGCALPLKVVLPSVRGVYG
jgi:hypothetical protein